MLASDKVSKQTTWSSADNVWRTF